MSIPMLDIHMFLVAKELKVVNSHTYINITETMNEITHTYNIQNSKISHTVTDNSSNFGKAFRTYSLKYFGQESLNVNSDN